MPNDTEICVKCGKPVASSSFFLHLQKEMLVALIEMKESIDTLVDNLGLLGTVLKEMDEDTSSATSTNATTNSASSDSHEDDEEAEQAILSSNTELVDLIVDRIKTPNA
jgi:hypothetical protein